MYKFIALDPRRGTDQLTTEEWARTIGIEVTIPALAAACGLGNVDGQHGMRETHPLWVGRAAVEIVCPSIVAIRDGDGSVSIPDDGAILATVRPDVDSVAAMAMLIIRSLDVTDSDGGGWDGAPTAMIARIRQIAASDCFTPGAAWAPRALPTLANLWPTTAAPVGETRRLAPLGVICSPAREQTQLPLADRVAILAMWLIYGDAIPAGADDVARAIGEVCGCRDVIGPRSVGGHIAGADMIANQARTELARALESGAVAPRLDAYQCVCGDETVAVAGGMACRSCGSSGLPAIAIVESAHIGAIGLGYCLAPIVVAAMPPGPAVEHEHRIVSAGGLGDSEVRPRKYTIAAWSADLIDFAALKAALCEIEPGWGGGASIVGSPQGAGSSMTIEQVLGIVRRFVRAS